MRICISLRTHVGGGVYESMRKRAHPYLVGRSRISFFFFFITIRRFKIPHYDLFQLNIICRNGYFVYHERNHSSFMVIKLGTVGLLGGKCSIEKVARATITPIYIRPRDKPYCKESIVGSRY